MLKKENKKESNANSISQYVTKKKRNNGNNDKKIKQNKTINKNNGKSQNG